MYQWDRSANAIFFGEGGRRFFTEGRLSRQRWKLAKLGGYSLEAPLWLVPRKRFFGGSGASKIALYF